MSASRPCVLRPVLVLCVLAVSSAGTSPARAEPPRFSIVAPGIAHATFNVRSADAEPFSGHAFKIDLDVAELRLVPAGDPSARRTVEQIVAPYPVVVAVNASFFDKDGRAMGLAVDEGRVMASSKRRNWGAFVIDGKEGRIIARRRHPEPPCPSPHRPGHPPSPCRGKGPAAKTSDRRADRGLCRGTSRRSRRFDQGRSYRLRTLPRRPS